MGKHSSVRISSFQVVDAWRILQFGRKIDKYFKNRVYMVLGDAVTKLERRLCESLTMFQES